MCTFLQILVTTNYNTSNVYRQILNKIASRCVQYITDRKRAPSHAVFILACLWSGQQVNMVLEIYGAT